jgi:Flp pilus assembly protein TadD
MPKLTLLQSVGLLVFLAFYGFTVFALTRDYYQRHPITVAAAPVANPHAAAQVQRRPAAGALDSAIPATVTESNPALLAQQADDLFVQGRYGEAIPLYRRILELSPDEVDAFNDLGLALFYTGDNPGALTILAQGTAKGPQFQRIWLTYGFVQFKTGEAAGAVAALTRARDLGPETGPGKEAVRLLGLMSGDGGGSRNMLSQAKAWHPTMPPNARGARRTAAG